MAVGVDRKNMYYVVYATIKSQDKSSNTRHQNMRMYASSNVLFQFSVCNCLLTVACRNGVFERSDIQNMFRAVRPYFK